MTSTQITVERSTLFSRSPGNRRPFTNYYECTGPDGRRFSNGSIVALRDVLRRRYGRDVVIHEAWKESRS